MTPIIKATVALAMIATPVTAQQNSNCAPRESVVERLQSVYGETRQNIAMDGVGRVFETWANNGTGSWTLTFTTPNGVTCLATSGDVFEQLAEVLPPKGTEGSKMR